MNSGEGAIVIGASEARIEFERLVEIGERGLLLADL